MPVTQRRVHKHVKRIAQDIQRLIAGIRKLKDRLTGTNLRRVHRIESELMTVAGQKSAVRRQHKAATRAGKRSKKA